MLLFARVPFDGHTLCTRDQASSIASVLDALDAGAGKPAALAEPRRVAVGGTGGRNGGTAGASTGGAAAGGTDGAAGGSAYEPCADKACGDACAPCDPDDPTCVPVLVMMTCDANGNCVQGSNPSCPTLWAETNASQYAIDESGTATLHNDTNESVYLPGCES